MKILYIIPVLVLFLSLPAAAESSGINFTQADSLSRAKDLVYMKKGHPSQQASKDLLKEIISLARQSNPGGNQQRSQANKDATLNFNSVNALSRSNDLIYK